MAKLIIKKIGGALPFLFWFSVVFGFNTVWVGILTVGAAAIHELGHEAALLLIGRKPNAPRGVFTGFRIKVGLLSYGEELAVLAAGPLANFIAFALATLPAMLFSVEYFESFAFINLMTGLSNLAVIRGYDGYGLISSILYIMEWDNVRETILRWLSLSFLIFSVLFSLYLMYRIGEGFWIFCILIYSLFSELEALRCDFFENSREKQRKNEEIKVFQKFRGG